MAEEKKRNECWTTEIPEEKFSQEKVKVLEDGQPSTETWQEFTDSTTLHGLKYVFKKRHFLVRSIWIILLLASLAYYVLTVYRAFSKYYSYPINTLVTTKQDLKEMDFPAVTVCSHNYFARSKLYMRDDNPLFASSGLNISLCDVTKKVRGDMACGLSLLCCCQPPHTVNMSISLPNCTTEYRKKLLMAKMQSSHQSDVEVFLERYSQDISSLVGPLCKFGLSTSCSAKDFEPIFTPSGMCYTFNSGNDGKVKIVNNGGVSSGLSIILDAQTPEYFQGKMSVGFKVLIHGQGEYIDEWEGINVGPGQHAVIALTQKRYKNLEKPYATRCAAKKLKTYSSYTVEGCFFECKAERIVKMCGCRTPGYKGASEFLTCTTVKEYMCVYKIHATVTKKTCGCEVPCSYTKYSAEVSYSYFPDPGTAAAFVRHGFYSDAHYQRENLVYLQVGFKTMSYELQEEQPAYDINSLFGEIGGSMGLFLGCSLLTIWEWLDFLMTQIVSARYRRATHPA